MQPLKGLTVVTLEHAIAEAILRELGTGADGVCDLRAAEAI